MVEAARQVRTQQLFAAESFFDVLEASSAVGCVRLLSLDASSWVDAEASWDFGEWNALFGLEVSVLSALQTVDGAGFLEVLFAAWLALGLVLAAVAGATAFRVGLTWAGTRFLEGFSSETIHAPGLTSRSVMLGGCEQAIFIALRSIAADHASAQSQGAFLVARRALRSIAARCNSRALDFLAVVGVSAPAVSSAAVALNRFVISVMGASRHEFARHFRAKMLSFSRAWTHEALW